MGKPFFQGFKVFVHLGLGNVAVGTGMGFLQGKTKELEIILEGGRGEFSVRILERGNGCGGLCLNG
jgi:hypothetical protein